MREKTEGVDEKEEEEGSMEFKKGRVVCVCVCVCVRTSGKGNRVTASSGGPHEQLYMST